MDQFSNRYSNSSKVDSPIGGGSEDAVESSVFGGAISTNLEPAL